MLLLQTLQSGAEGVRLTSGEIFAILPFLVGAIAALIAFFRQQERRSVQSEHTERDLARFMKLVESLEQKSQMQAERIAVLTQQVENLTDHIESLTGMLKKQATTKRIAKSIE